MTEVKGFHSEHLLRFTTLPVTDRSHHDFRGKMAFSRNTRTCPCGGSSEITNPNIYLTSADNIRFGRQQIDDFPFALVSPLRAEHHRHFVPRVVARSLLSGYGGLIHVFLVFCRPGERHDGGGFSLPVSRRLSRLPRVALPYL